MDNLKLSVNQYQQAIKHALSVRQIEVLQILYAFPDSTATAKELASLLSPASPSPIVASGQIGRIGKTIAQYLEVTPYLYAGGKGEGPAYFSLVGPYTGPEGVRQGKRPGWAMRANLKRALLRLGLVGVEDKKRPPAERLPTEELFDEQQSYKEGKVVPVFVNRYERSQEARLACIRHLGDTCFVCGFNFGEVYGKLAKGFIHVHHKTPLAEINQQYQVDPLQDLVPLCANCHSVIHLTKPALSVEALQKLMNKRSR